MNVKAAIAARTLELGRFCTVGLICVALGAGIVAGLCELAGLNYLLAYAISFLICNSLGYVLNGKFTFSVRYENSGVLRYMAVNACLLAVSSLLLKGLVDGLHVWYLSGTLILAAVNAPLSFLIHRVVSYRSAPRLAGAR